MSSHEVNLTRVRVPFLQRRFQSRFKRRSGPVLIVPLVDMTFLVLLYLILNSHIILKPGISMTLPAVPFENGAPLNALVLTLSQEGLIFFNDERTTLDVLPNQFTQAVQTHAAPALVVEADQRIPHGTLMRIYALAQNAGFSEVILATRAATDPSGTER